MKPLNNKDSKNFTISYGSIPYEPEVEKVIDDDDDPNEVIPTRSRFTSAAIGIFVSIVLMSGVFMVANNEKSGISNQVNWLFSQFSTTTFAQPSSLPAVAPGTSMLPGLSVPTPPVPSDTPTIKPTTVSQYKSPSPTKKPTKRPSKSPTYKPSHKPTVNDGNVAADTTLPHFVLIVADDLSWNSIGYTSDELSFVTPTLTSLAQEGIIMNNFYGQEVCSPARGSLLTGRYPLSIGMQYGMVAATVEWGMPLDEVTLPEVLKDNGYKTHMLGKWHLGYFSPLFLPTARGFDDWIGYANGENYYWSKKSPDYPEFSDFIISDTDCYKAYDGDDKHEYSTIFYTDKAINIIDEHSTADPLFLYVAYQAVHDPFVDYGKFKHGVPDEMVDSDVLTVINSKVVGRTRQEYAKSLYLLDQGVEKIYNALDDKGILDTTYIIFMSDNGGCWYGGGKNSPLRGSKGALFEGGTKVDSFIYSPNLANSGTVYDGLMHISDWFPTILALANINYEPDDEHSLDGVNHFDGWQGSKNPRSSMLYNMYVDLSDYNFNIWTNGSFAVRDSRFKLMHTYDDSDYGAWNRIDEEDDEDDDLDSDDRCAQQFLTGTFTYWLFDLQNDPFETTNLYDSDENVYTMAKEKLYSLLPDYLEKATTKIGLSWSDKAEKFWHTEGNNILPWADTSKLVNGDKYDYPDYCPE
jgi:arylsulfatase A-like enzyme